MYTIAETSQKVQALLWEEADQAGIEVGFVQRKRKLTGSSFVKAVVGANWADPQASTRDIQQAAKASGVEMSRQGVDQRYGPTAAALLERVLKRAVEEMVTGEPVRLQVFNHFTAVRLVDSTVISLPSRLEMVWQGCGQGKSSLKLTVDWDLRTGRLDGPHLAAARQHDNALLGHHQPMQAGELCLRDLAYFDLDSFAAIEEAGAYWLSYYKVGTHILTPDGQWLNLLKHLPQTDGEILDIPIRLGKDKQLIARLVAVRLEPAAVHKRRKQITETARRKQEPISDRAWELAQWMILVTNIPATVLTVEELCVLVGCRWQIERLFRLWKEVGRIDEWRSHKPWHILCELYAKLIACVLQHWITLLALWPVPNRSLHQASKTIRRYVYPLIHALRDESACTHLLIQICEVISGGCRIEPSSSARYTYERLLALELGPLN